MTGLYSRFVFHMEKLFLFTVVHAATLNVKACSYLPGGTWLDVGGADVLGPPLQAEVVG